MGQVFTLVEQASGEGQDRLSVFTHDDGEVILLADGAGGRGDGTAAAESFLAYTTEELMGRSFPEDPMELEAVARRLDRHMALLSAGCEASVCAILIGARQVVGFSVGDTQAWLFDEGLKLEWTSFQERKPLFGSGRAVPIAFGPFAPKGRLLLASDGLFGYAYMNAIAPLLEEKPPSQALLEELAGLVRLPSGGLQDDLAMVLYEF